MTYQEYDNVPAYVPAIWENNELANSGAGLLWSGKDAPPAIGDEIVITINRLGSAIVTGYFSEGEWLGVLCSLIDPPDWHVRQNNGDPTGHVFGAEFQRKEKGQA